MRSFLPFSLLCWINDVPGVKCHGLERVKLRPDVEAQVQELRKTTWGERVNFDSAAGGALCSDPALDYIFSLISGISEEDLLIIEDLAIDQIPFFYSLFIDWHESEEYFGTFGEETQEMVLAHAALETFWGEPDDGSQFKTDNILFLGMHGADMKNASKLLPTLELMYDISETTLTYLGFVEKIQSLIESMPHEYDNPLLTFNAFAYSNETEGDKIVIGDGVIEYLHYQNLGAEGPEVVLSHEFGHHMQFEMNLQEIGGLPESLETRRFELMADALSGYFLAHGGGGNVQDHRILELQRAAFSIGDCDAEDPGHHGTPSQRECAMIWGINRAVAATSDKDMLRPWEISALFDNDLERIVDLDKTVCTYSFSSIPGSTRNAPGGANRNTTTVTVTTTTTTTEETVTTTITESASG